MDRCRGREWKALQLVFTDTESRIGSSVGKIYLCAVVHTTTYVRLVVFHPKMDKTRC